MSTSTSTQLLGLSSFGVASFLKAPIVSLDSDWAADVAFLGVPFDQATGFRTGTRFGPRAIPDLTGLRFGGRLTTVSPV